MNTVTAKLPNILLANKYFYRKGGADNSFFQTSALLENQGHKVAHFSMHDDKNLDSPYAPYFINHVDYEKKDLKTTLGNAGKLLYSREARYKIRKLIRDERPDIAHLNNIYHQISPSIIHELKNFNIPVVMSLRDYKVVCGAYTMLANDQICEACRGGRYYQGFLKNCHKGSRFKGALITLEMYLHHKVLHIYDLVDCFISPSQFLKDKVEEMGFKGRVEYLPNFVYPDHIEPRYSFDGNALVYMGRLSHEKGVRTLIKAAGSIPDVQLKIIGDGPARAELENYVTDERLSNVTFLGYMSGDKLNNEIKGAKCVVIPSEWYENNPRSVIESFAMGKPVIGARIGGIPELVRDNETGMTFISGDEKDLSEKINYALADDERIKRWGQNARRLIEDEYSAQKHYQGLRAIYDEVLANARQT